MASMPQQLESQLKAQYGVTEQQPRVFFVDWAVEDAELTKKSGRPRFKDTVFIEKHPVGGFVRDVFRRRMEEKDKEDFPREWQAYLDKREQVANRAPPLAAMPGMTRAIFEELHALGLKDCEMVAHYEGDLDVLEPFRETARKIMEIGNVQNRALRKERDQVRETVERPIHGTVDRAGSSGETPDRGFAGRIPEGFAGKEETHYQKAAQKGQKETFRYEFSA